MPGRERSSGDRQPRTAEAIQPDRQAASLDSPARSVVPADGSVTARLRPHDVLQLQRTLGNRATSQELRARPPRPRGAGRAHPRAPDGLIQRVQYQEFVTANQGYTDILHRWLDQRCPGKPGQLTLEKATLLHNFSEEDLKTILSTFESRMMWDDSDPLTDDQEIETHLTDSKIIGEIVTELRQHRSILGKITFLKDADFQSTYVKVTLSKNPQLSDQVDIANAMVARRVDQLDGFTYQGQIFARTALIADKHVLIHESIHFFGHDSFEDALGHPMNEGMTELLAQEVSQEAGVRPNFFAYQAEMSLLDQVMRAAGISKEAMIAAYFSGNIGGVLDALVQTIGGQNAQVLADQRDAREATALFESMLQGRIESNQNQPTVWTNRQDTSGQTDLHRAVVAGQRIQVLQMIEQHVRVDLPDRRGRTPLILAAAQAVPDHQIVRALLRAHADVHTSDDSRHTPLHHALSQQQPSTGVLNALLQAGADVNVAGSQGRTPLHCALELGHGNLVVQLLPHADVFLENFDEETLLMVAARRKLPKEVLTAIGGKHQQVTQNWLSLATDVHVRVEPRDDADSVTLSKLSSAYLIKQVGEWYQVVYVGDGFALAKCFIKRSDPVSIKD